MFELSVAKKYLTPKWRQLSVSIISIISILVISLVVWLIVVFFSVTNGLEKGWVDKLVSLTAPIRVTPTKEYYQSHYYLIDSISEASDYTAKNIQEKLNTVNTDPHDPSTDEAPPLFFAPPLLNEDGTLKDLIKEAYLAIESIKEDLQPKSYEVTGGNMRIKLLRNAGNMPTESVISQATYFGSFDGASPKIQKTLLPLSQADISHLNALSKTRPTERIYLPKIFKDASVLAGDLATLSYYSGTMSGVQEQQVEAYVAGFYDPGLIPIGGKLVLTAPELVSLMRSSQQQEQQIGSNGINVHFESLEKTNDIKEAIEKNLKDAGLNNYFKVETYREYDFTKDILQQLQSDKTLFTLISSIIIIVACSNIVSMLIIMVNDKKTEIGILRSMGTTSFSIAVIFGTCGVVMGLLGGLIGTVAAYFTLKNMDLLMAFLSNLQGHNAFNPAFYGETLPNEISFEALVFVLVSTALISLVAGIVPAIKASCLRPSAILKAE